MLFTIPRSKLRYCLFLGVCICILVSSSFYQVWPLLDIIGYQRLHHLVLIKYLSKLGLMPSFLVHSISSCRLCHMVFLITILPNTCTSSTILPTPLQFLYAWSIFLWRMSWPILYPKGILRSFASLPRVCRRLWWVMMLHQASYCNILFWLLVLKGKF